MISNARINIATNWSGTGAIGDYYFQTALHEIGHTLGLGHSGLYNAGSGVPTYNDAYWENDTTQYTTMSYWTQNNYTATGENTPSGSFLGDVDLIRPQAVDCLAPNRRYGPMGYGINDGATTGNTTWGFNDTWGTSTTPPVSNTLTNAFNSMGSLLHRTSLITVDGGGIDTLNLSGFANNTKIDVSEVSSTHTRPSFSNVAGLNGNLMIGVGTIIENVVGGAGTKLIYGNGAANNIQGGAGNDSITGSDRNERFILMGGTDNLDAGGGWDSLRYDRSGVGAVTVNLATGLATSTWNGSAFTHNISGIEEVHGSRNDSDNITGDDNENWFRGRDGDDTLNGGGGDDTLIGEQGNDVISGGAGTDVAEFWLNRGEATISQSGGNVTVTSALGTDVLSGVETLRFYDQEIHIDTSVATADADTIEGTGGADNFDGLAGDDLMTGLAGNDTLQGSAGDDALDGGTGNDLLISGLGNDTYLIRAPGDSVVEQVGEGIDAVHAYRSYALEAHVEKLFMQNVFTRDGDPTNLNGIGNGLDNTIIGTPFDNTLIEREGNDVLKGQAGDDTLKFKASALGGGVSAGVLDAADFTTDAAAADASDRFVFDQTSGQLWYDIDGIGAAAQVLLTTFEQNAVVQADDILVFYGAAINAAPPHIEWKPVL